MRVRADGRIRKIQAEDRKRVGAHRQNARGPRPARSAVAPTPPGGRESAVAVTPRNAAGRTPTPDPTSVSAHFTPLKARRSRRSVARTRRRHSAPGISCPYCARYSPGRTCSRSGGEETAPRRSRPGRRRGSQIESHERTGTRESRLRTLTPVTDGIGWWCDERRLRGPHRVAVAIRAGRRDRR